MLIEAFKVTKGSLLNHQSCQLLTGD